jgi:hypothetical protein
MQPHIGELWRRSPSGTIAWLHEALCCNPALATEIAPDGVALEAALLEHLPGELPDGNHTTGKGGRVYLLLHQLTAEQVAEIRASALGKDLTSKQLERLIEALRHLPAGGAGCVRYAGQTHTQRRHGWINQSGPGALARFLRVRVLPLKLVLLPDRLD